jgi:hypothetical protein
MQRDPAQGIDCTLQLVTDGLLPEFRASDADREQTADLLRRAAGEGRLTIEELDERLNTVYETRTRRELDRLTADVVARDGGGDGVSRLVSVLSGHDRRGRWRVARRLSIINIFGGSSIDLNDAQLTSHETQITQFSLCGGGDIRVPDGVNIKTSGFAVMGGNETKVGEQTPDPGGPVIKIRMISILGWALVERGRKLSRAERKALKHSGH